jgi:hypothetical protein
LRALQAGEASGEWPHRHYAIARLCQHSNGVESISAEHTSGRMKADGAIAARPLMFGGKNGSNRDDR